MTEPPDLTVGEVFDLYEETLAEWMRTKEMTRAVTMADLGELKLLIARHSRKQIPRIVDAPEWLKRQAIRDEA